MSPGPGPMYNVRMAGRAASLNGNTGAKNSQVKYSFGKEERRPMAEVVRHGRSVPDGGYYSPNAAAVQPKV